MTLFLKLVNFIRFIIYTGLILVSVSVILSMALIFMVSHELPRLPSPLSRIIETPQTQIYASTGQVLISLGERKTIPLNMVSNSFLDAIVATEDHRFYHHRGVNKLRTFKGLYLTLFKGDVQGASTITQQLAKNLFFSFEKTYKRKLKEMLVAFQIEAVNSKSEILHAYINQIHFGAGAQGIEKASRTFFGKSALDLTLPEAALLAGLPKSPTYYNPYRHYEKAIKRRDVVLNRMVQAGFISRLQAEAAMKIRPELAGKHSDSRTGSYFLDALISELIKQYGEDVVYHGGIKVYSTLDVQLQAYAESAIKNGLDRLDNLMGLAIDEKDHPQAALVAVDCGSGAVKAMVGGKDYYTSEFNRAVNSHRQAGSGFKPFLYYAAFKSLGYHPGTVMTDKPVLIPVKGSKSWQPRNFSKMFSGDMILKQAMIRSVNTVAAQMVQQTGPGPVIETAKLCGIKSRLNDVYSVALGTSGVSPLEMASAYSVLSTLGVKHDSFMFWRVEDAFGRVIFEHIVKEKRVLDTATAYQIVDMMKSVIESGSGRVIRSLGFTRTAAGKTGTTDSYHDSWFTGFTPSLSVSVWTGFDQQKSMRDLNQNGITGGRGAAPIWAEFMTQALRTEPERDFPIPEEIQFVTVKSDTGCPPAEEELGDGSFLKVALKKDQHPCEVKPE